MINLLPDATKTSYGYARRNVSLRNWAVALVVSLAGLGALATYGLLTIHRQINDYNYQVVSTKEQLSRDKLDETQKKITDITTSSKLAVQVLGQEVLFSKLITQIGAAMPNGTILTGLNINKIAGGLTLSANATTYTTGTQIQVNLSAATNKIFSKVDIDNVSCSSQNSSDQAYPCTVTLRALFNSNNQFLFINEGKK